MPSHVSRSPDWWEDVLSTYLHISDDSVEAADAYLDAVEAQLDRLLEFPELGTPVPLATGKLRGLRVIPLSSTYRKHLVFYIPQKTGIHVARILYRSRDIESLLLAS